MALVKDLNTDNQINRLQAQVKMAKEEMNEENDATERPAWFAEKLLNGVLFCEAFLEHHPMVHVGGSFFTKEGRVTDKGSIRKRVYEMPRP